VSGRFTGTGHLLRLILRRDRLRLPVWLLGLGGTIALSALVVPPIYDTPEKIAGYAATVGGSPVSYLMSGRQAAIDTIGGIVANEISQVAQLGICLMVMFLVVRHTRAEEESGRAELVRSAVLGRHAAPLAGLGYGAAAAAVIGLVTTGSMLAAGLDGVGSAAYGVGLTLLGFCYASLTLVAAQLAASARGALGLAGAAIALGYLVRGVGAMRDSALVWASPFGWAQEMDAFGTEKWWPALLLLALTFAGLGLSGWLIAHRDFAGGVLQVRPGSPRAARFLGTPIGLVVRLQRGLLIGWAVGLTALGLLYGAVIPLVPELIESNPDIAQMIGSSSDAEDALIDGFLQYIFVIMAVISTGFVVASVLRLRTEEESGRAEVVLATPVPRAAWFGATVLVSTVGALVLSLVMGVGLAVGYALGMGEWDQVGQHVAGQLSYLPGVLVIGGVAIAVVGLRPRASMLAWAGVLFVAFQVMMGETLRLPGWVDGISPFPHLSRLPVETFQPGPAVVELAVAGALAVLGLWGYRNRDVTAT